MSRSFEDVEFGEELDEFVPDVSLANVRRFVSVARMNFGRFGDHEQAKKEGLPGAIVPGIMSQGLLAALIHRWVAGAKIRHQSVWWHYQVSFPILDSVSHSLSVFRPVGETDARGEVIVRVPAMYR